jgi:GH43 family beta-xylosidase
MHTYLNPVYQHESADPFVLKFKGEYWCYRTGECPDGRIFGILHSKDLLHWQYVGSAMDALTPPVEHYWAPEVFYANGYFYLYYAAGLGPNFHLRLAVAKQPQGPFADSGKRLTQDPFAIDAHVFEEDDGLRYLFYAVDFLDHTRVGTGTVMDRLLDPATLAGESRPVSRARYDWQIFDPCRAEKGGVCWHTVEGSFTLKHKGRYYQMFSGGNYQNPSYGVGYAVTTTLDRADEWDQSIDGETRLPVLRTIPGKVNGPGHNSVVRGPDNRQNFCAYHVIKKQERFERILAIDPLEWVGERLVVLGPSADPQPAPILPAVIHTLEDPAGLVQRSAGGEFLLSARAGANSPAQIPATGPAFLLETSLRFPAPGICAVTLTRLGKPILEFVLDCEQSRAGVGLAGAAPRDWRPLPPGFDPAAVHLLRLEADFQRCRLWLDHSAFRWEGVLSAPVDAAGFSVPGGAVELAALQLTRGFEETFEHTGVVLAGWTAPAEAQDGLLRIRPAVGETAVLRKPLALAGAELVLNVALQAGARCVVLAAPLGKLTLSGQGLDWEGRLLDPTAFIPVEMEQIRLRKQGGELLIMRGASQLAVLPVSSAPVEFSLAVESPGADIDLVRLTEVMVETGGA